ncbi:MAG: hypothetical protein KDD70_14035 [Bdellovibrionales bacterium]|nr:hypothetical protein [Bdellovibrionales bacterium]
MKLTRVLLVLATVFLFITPTQNASAELPPHEVIAAYQFPLGPPRETEDHYLYIGTIFSDPPFQYAVHADLITSSSCPIRSVLELRNIESNVQSPLCADSGSATGSATVSTFFQGENPIADLHQCTGRGRSDAVVSWLGLPIEIVRSTSRVGLPFFPSMEFPASCDPAGGATK